LGRDWGNMCMKNKNFFKQSSPFLTWLDHKMNFLIGLFLVRS
jgi:hypothetical protein